MITFETSSFPSVKMEFCHIHPYVDVTASNRLDDVKVIKHNGETVIYIEIFLDNKTSIYSSATAICHPGDFFNKSVGRLTALDKVLTGMQYLITPESSYEIYSKFMSIFPDKPRKVRNKK